MVGGLLWGWLYLTSPQTLPLKSVKVQASFKHIDALALQKVIAPYARGGFFSINIGKLREQLKQLPWVKQVSIWRVWPDTLEVSVVEKQAVARWGHDDLLSADGEIFQPVRSTFPSELPQLNGPQDQAQEILAKYQEMSKLLVSKGLGIVKLDLSDNRAWQLLLDNKMQLILGREEVIPRLKRFMFVYPKIFTPKGKQAETVDLRYGNGIAVRWKDQAMK